MLWGSRTGQPNLDHRFSEEKEAQRECTMPPGLGVDCSGLAAGLSSFFSADLPQDGGHSQGWLAPSLPSWSTGSGLRDRQDITV
jgi:hypothetical protein